MNPGNTPPNNSANNTNGDGRPRTRTTRRSELSRNAAETARSSNPLQLFPPMFQPTRTNQSMRPTLLGSQSGIFRNSGGQGDVSVSLPLQIPPVPRFDDHGLFSSPLSLAPSQSRRHRGSPFGAHNSRASRGSSSRRTVATTSSYAPVLLPPDIDSRHDESAGYLGLTTLRLVSGENANQWRTAGGAANPRTTPAAAPEPGSNAITPTYSPSLLPLITVNRRQMMPSEAENEAANQNANGSRSAPRSNERSPKRQRVSAEDPPRYSVYTEDKEHRLNMKIMSCNCRGVNKKAPHGWLKHPIENVLTHDRSVFVSEKATVDLFLRHEGNTPFSLSRIVIETPQAGFNDQVQDGLVFVSDDPEQILIDSAGYGIWYDDAEATNFEEQQFEKLTRETPDADCLALHVRSEIEAKEDGPVDIRTLRYPYSFSLDIDKLDWDDSWNSLKGMLLWQQEAVFDDPAVINEPEYKRLWLSEMNAHQVVETGEPPKASSTDEEQPTDEAVEADRFRRIEWGQGDNFSDSEYEDEEMADMRVNRRHQFPVVWLESNMSRSILESSDRPKDTKKIIAVPQAQFRLNRKEFCSNLEFKPPITGKYILIKMFAPCGSASLDVQTIRVYGISGMCSVNANSCI